MLLSIAVMLLPKSFGNQLNNQCPVYSIQNVHPSIMQHRQGMHHIKRGIPFGQLAAVMLL
jgi:folate-dependent phosphoribosylglycinamide formyltransferase PurN